MKRWIIRMNVAAAAIAFQAVALYGGVNQWTTHGPGPPAAIGAMAVDPMDPLTIYAAGNPFLFKSVDGGETWGSLAPEEALLFAHVNCVAVDPTHPATVYVGKSGGTFLSSHDGGIQWESQVIDPLAYSLPISIAVDAGTGAIYAGTDFDSTYPQVQNGVYQSTDGGTTWNGTAPTPRLRTGYALLADSLNERLLVGTDFAYSVGYYYYSDLFTVRSGGRVARAVNGGASWSLSPEDLGSPVLALAKDAQGSTYYAGTEAGALYRSVNGGANWAPLARLPGTVTALAVDPSAPSVLYAATRDGRGLLRSTDGGATWRSFNSGMSTRWVTALTIDPTGQILHAGTVQGVFDLEVAPEPVPEPCAPGPDHLCLFGSRFRVDLTAINPFTKAPFAATSVPVNSRSGYFTFPSLTGDSTFPEVMVKMVDATSLPEGGYWVFYAGMTSLLYTVRVTDTTTGQAQEYSGESSCGGADVSGFLSSSSPGGYLEAASPLGAPETPGHPSEADLALLSGRFRVRMKARNPETAAVADGLAIPQADRFGSFSLPAFTGDPGLPEVFVKMIDAGGGSFFFFHTALTSLEYTLTVFDTVTETERTYVRQKGDPTRPCGANALLMFAK